MVSAVRYLMGNAGCSRAAGSEGRLWYSAGVVGDCWGSLGSLPCRGTQLKEGAARPLAVLAFSLLPQCESDLERASKDESFSIREGAGPQGSCVGCGANLAEQQHLQGQEFPEQIRACSWPL